MRYVTLGKSILDTKNYKSIAEATDEDTAALIVEALNEHVIEKYICSACGCINDGAEDKCWACGTELPTAWHLPGA